MASPNPPSRPSLGSVLVVGGCGFLGHHIVRQLLASYTCTLSVLDLQTTRNRFEGVTYHSGDITSESSITSIFHTVKPQIIIHTASPTVYLHPSTNLYEKVNVHGTRNLLACASATPSVKAFIYTSSASVVHDTLTPLVNADETYPVLRAPAQREFYAETKGIAEGLVLAANRQPRPNNNTSTPILTCAIRPAVLFGEGDIQAVPGFYGAYKRSQTGFQLGDNTNLFDFTYVENAAHAHILAAVALLRTAAMAPNITPLSHERVDGEAFFITNGEPMYFWDFARAIWAHAGDTREPQTGVWVVQRDLGLVIAGLIEWVFWILFWGKRAPSLTKRIVNYSALTRYFNIEKARKRLGYEPVTGVEVGLKRSVEWLMEKEKADAEEETRLAAAGVEKTVATQ
ncbi:erg26, C-3 sterol dehydrogenase [Varicellaria rhodocarpa]|nr:erg26, C-3 sterol dehydrogenase [Varicellaria rhodocarpa]